MLAPRELPGRQRPAHGQALAAAEVLQLTRHRTDRVLQIQRVSEVELPTDLRGAGEGDLVGVDVEPPTIRRPATLGSSQVGHEPGHRLIEQPLQLGGPDASGHRGDVNVHERRRLG